jgi:hypothetical protein
MLWLLDEVRIAEVRDVHDVILSFWFCVTIYL